LPVVKSKAKDSRYDGTTLSRKMKSIVGDCCAFMQREVEAVHKRKEIALRLLNFDPKLCVCFTFVLVIFVKRNVRI
jgi:hypothetical protein